MAVFLITGANRGIGLELTRQTERRGDSVIAACRNPAAASELAKLAGEAGGRVEIIALDVGEPASIAAATARLGTRPIDVLINNAGIKGPARQSGLDMDFDGLEQTLAVNAIGPLRVTQALLPNLRAAEKARVVAISSGMASLTDPASSSLAYRASKTALNKLFQGLATDLEPVGIAVLILAPGWVRTDMGGGAAPLSVAESVAGLLREIDALTLARSGHFRDYVGQEVPW
jgi:NAD(P)-dependent dehydrogenase (short-subunit alcohol dehydrogenase family)